MSEFLDITTEAPLDVVAESLKAISGTHIEVDPTNPSYMYLMSDGWSAVIIKRIDRLDSTEPETFIMVNDEFPHLQSQIWELLKEMPFRSTLFDDMDEPKEYVLGSLTPVTSTS